MAGTRQAPQVGRLQALPALSLFNVDDALFAHVDVDPWYFYFAPSTESSAACLLIKSIIARIDILGWWPAR